MNEWISVMDRLPDVFQPVIVCRKGKNGTRTKSVTHWMPLPEPPSGIYIRVEELEER